MLITPLLSRGAASRGRHVLVGALLVATTAAGLLLGAAPARADDVSSISIAPDDGRSRFDYQAAPGQSVDDVVRVTNTGTTPQDVTVFAADALNAADGSYSLIDTDKPSVDGGSWVVFGDQPRMTLTLQPGEARAVPFTVRVPDDARPGDHAAGIVASALDQSDQILVDRRVATRLYARVPGDLQPALAVTGLSASYDGVFNPFDGSVTLTYTVENTGNVALAGTTAVGVRTWFGIGVGEVLHPEIPEILPGNKLQLTSTVPGIAQLGFVNPYLQIAPVTPDTGSLDIAPPALVSRDTFIPAIPWILLILLAAGGVAFLIIRISGDRSERRAAEWLAYTRQQAREQARDELVGAGHRGDGASSPTGESRHVD